MALSDCEDIHRALRRVLKSSNFGASYGGDLSFSVNVSGMWGNDRDPHWLVFDKKTQLVVSEISVRSASEQHWEGVSRVFTYKSVQFALTEDSEYLARDDKQVYTLEDLSRILSESEPNRL